MNLLIHHKKSLVLMPILCYESRAERDFADLIPALATAVRSDDMKADLPSPETLRKLLRYEPETGKLFWREREREFFKTDRDWKKWNTRFAGAEGFTNTGTDGYKYGAVFGRLYGAHRVVWAMEIGSWPNGQIDHIDRNKTNNLISNLRDATGGQNQMNTSSRAGSSSKYLGVGWCKNKEKWQARITKDGKHKFLGYFNSEVAAAVVYDDAAKEIQGEFASLNFSPEAMALAIHPDMDGAVKAIENLVKLADAVLDYADANCRAFPIATAPNDRAVEFWNKARGKWELFEWRDLNALSERYTHWREPSPPPTTPPLPVVFVELGAALEKIKGAG